MCMQHTSQMQSMKSLAAGVQGPLKGPGCSRAGVLKIRPVGRIRPGELVNLAHETLLICSIVLALLGFTGILSGPFGFHWNLIRPFEGKVWNALWCYMALLPGRGSNRGPPVWKSEALTTRPRQLQQIKCGGECCMGLTSDQVTNP